MDGFGRLESSGSVWSDDDEEEGLAWWAQKVHVKGVASDLPRVTRQALERVAHDKQDPLSDQLLASAHRYEELREKCEEKRAGAHGRHATNQVLRDAEQARVEAGFAFEELQRLFEQREQEAASRVQFQEGHNFLVEVVKATNLPRVSLSGGVDPYCVVLLKPPDDLKIGPDGRKVFCPKCKEKTNFRQQKCRHHKSETKTNTIHPVWHKTCKVQLSRHTPNVYVAIFDSSRTGPHLPLGWFYIPCHLVLYHNPTVKEYVLLNTDGKPMQQSDGGERRTITLQFHMKVTYTDTKPIFHPPGTSERMFTGFYGKRWVSGNTYVGEWMDGLPHGQGRFIGKEGIYYEGTWRRAKMHGKGHYRFRNGDVYDGHWKEGKRHGKGRVMSVNGDVYEGDFRMGYQCGEGTHTSSSGQIYRGEWKHNKAHGSGTFETKQGKRDGIWYEGKPILVEKPRPPTPRESRSRRNDIVVENEEPVDWTQFNLSALGYRYADEVGQHLPWNYQDGFAHPKKYPTDFPDHDEELHDVPTCWFDRNSEAMAHAPTFSLKIKRVEKAMSRTKAPSVLADRLMRAAGSKGADSESTVQGQSPQRLPGQSLKPSRSPSLRRSASSRISFAESLEAPGKLGISDISISEETNSPIKDKDKDKDAKPKLAPWVKNYVPDDDEGSIIGYEKEEEEVVKPMGLFGMIKYFFSNRGKDDGSSESVKSKESWNWAFGKNKGPAR